MPDGSDTTRVKMTLLGVLFSIAGLLLILVGTDSEYGLRSELAWLSIIPLSEIGSTLFGIGVVGIAYDHYTRLDEERNAMRRLREPHLSPKLR